MTNALKAFLMSTATGQGPVQQGLQYGMQRLRMQQLLQHQAEQQALAKQAYAERVRQFNQMLPIRQQGASSKALTALTGAGSLDLNERKFAAKPGEAEGKHNNMLSEIAARGAARMGDLGIVGAIGAQGQQPDFSAYGSFGRFARGTEVGQAGKKEAARQSAITAGAKARAPLKTNAQGDIKERQLLGNIAKALHARSMFEAQAGDLRKAGSDFDTARKRVNDEVAYAIAAYRQVTGRPAPGLAELQGAMQDMQGTQVSPAQTNTATSAEDLAGKLGY